MKPNTKRLGSKKVNVELDSHGAIKVKVSITLGSPYVCIIILKLATN
jgi:pyruvate/2-oxoglutarate dehydrogenase complex dihydrolipoamide dehydrogenase (E3) component